MHRNIRMNIEDLSTYKLYQYKRKDSQGQVDQGNTRIGCIDQDRMLVIDLS